MAPSRGPHAPGRHLHTALTSHRGAVHVARYSKGAATYVLTGGQDRTVRLWNAHSGAQIKTFEAHGYEVLSIAVSKDNSKFASSGGDRTAYLWDVASGATTRRLPGHLSKIHVVEFNEDATILASGSADSTVRLWDLKSQGRQPIQILEDARDAVQTIHISGPTIITGSVDGTMRTYDIRMGELRTDYLGQPVTSVLPTADNQTVLVTTLNSHIRLMDVSTGKMLNDFTGHKNDSYRSRACFGHGEATVVMGDEDGKVWAWDLLDAKLMQPNPPPIAHDKVITWTEHHPTEPGEMITASADGTVKVWRSTPRDS